MTPLDEHWRTAALARQLEAAWRDVRGDAVAPPLDVRAIAEVDSTNTRLLDEARAATWPQLRLLVAQSQTAGRGRMGRAWHASPGASLAFSIAVPVLPSPCLSLAIGAAAADAIEPLGAGTPGAAATLPRLMLKWPNDLWLRDATAPLGGRKLAGILLETATTGTGRSGDRVLVAGLGFNVRPFAVGDAPPDPPPAYGRASVAEIDDRLDAVELLHRVAPAVLRALLAPRHATHDSTWHAAWSRRDILAGRRVEALIGGAPTPGVACGVRGDGALLLRADADGQILAVASGEVSIRPLPQTTPPHPVR